MYQFEDVSILNIIQVKFNCFLCRIVPYTSLQEWGGKLDPHPPEYQSKIILQSFLILNYLVVKIYQFEDVSILNIIQVKFSCFLCQFVLYA